MRRHFYLSIVAFLFCMFGNFTTSKAQTSIDITLYDSSGIHCSSPAELYFSISGTSTGYTSPGTVDIDINYGDGTTENFDAYHWASSGVTGYISAGGFYHNYTMPGSYTITAVATAADGSTDTEVLTILITSTCGNVSGTVYMDNNTNNVYDAGDQPLSYHWLEILDGTGTSLGWVMSDVNGVYGKDLPLGSTFTLAYDNTYFTGITPVNPATGSYTFAVSATPMVMDFGFTCATGHDYMVVGPSSGFVPGQIGYVYPQLSKLSCEGSAPLVLTVTLDPALTYVSTYMGPAPTSISGSTLTWNLASMAGPYAPWWTSYLMMGIKVQVATTATLGDVLCSTMSISSTGDVNAANDTHNSCATVVSSYDPNMKEVWPRGEGAEGFVDPNPAFEYTVHFQNTGTYQAFNIYIMDTLDTDLDLSTFEITGTSHAMIPYIVNNVVKFDYPNINLPDSTSNEPLSHGWVKYKIKAKTGLAEGTKFTNTAHIFFDYNPAVVTNTTLNTIRISTGLADVEMSKNFTVYPNPSGTYVNINAADAVGRTAYVYDITGKNITSVTIGSTGATLDVSRFENGLYEIVIPGSVYTSSRFVVNK